MLIPSYINSISVCACVIHLDMYFSFQFDEEFLSRQEAQAQLVKCEEKITELQAELQAFRTQVYLTVFLLIVWFVLHPQLSAHPQYMTFISLFLNVHFCKLMLLLNKTPKSTTELQFNFLFLLFIMRCSRYFGVHDGVRGFIH